MPLDVNFAPETNSPIATISTPKRGPGRPPKYPWRSMQIGTSFNVGLRPGKTIKAAKKFFQTLASQYRVGYGLDFKVTGAGRSITVTRVG